VRSLVLHFPITRGNINTLPQRHAVGGFRKTEWWATQESNLACVSARELQSLLYGFEVVSITLSKREKLLQT